VLVNPFENEFMEFRNEGLEETGESSRLNSFETDVKMDL
jgi:hypothetical protein